MNKQLIASLILSTLSFGAFALLEAGVDFVGQFRVVEHFLMGNKNLADGFGRAALNQTFNVLSHLSQCVVQALALHH